MPNVAVGETAENWSDKNEHLLGGLQIWSTDQFPSEPTKCEGKCICMVCTSFMHVVLSHTIKKQLQQMKEWQWCSYPRQEVIRNLVKRYVAAMIRSAKTDEGLTEENFKVPWK